eukprot:12411412-Alexandrium_andersonii.AAC.1
MCGPGHARGQYPNLSRVAFPSSIREVAPDYGVCRGSLFCWQSQIASGCGPGSSTCLGRWADSS